MPKDFICKDEIVKSVGGDNFVIKIAMESEVFTAVVAGLQYTIKWKELLCHPQK